ncbi:MAG: PAS domain S-box protein [Gemmatimonadota bacterium]
MPTEGRPGPDLADLRRRAEARLRAPLPGEREPATGTVAQIRELLHELHTHQVELELQNEDLRRAQLALVEARDRYADLYDFAPVGYLSLDARGQVEETNLRAAEMLGLARDGLVGQPLAGFLAPKDQDALHLQLESQPAGPARGTRVLASVPLAIQGKP